MQPRSVSLVVLATLCFAFTGCASEADKAAQEVLDIALEMKELQKGGDPANAEDGMGKMTEAFGMLRKMMAAAQKLEAETNKMSPAEKEAFEKKWQQKFKDAGLDPDDMN